MYARITVMDRRKGGGRGEGRGERENAKLNSAVIRGILETEDGASDVIIRICVSNV